MIKDKTLRRETLKTLNLFVLAYEKKTEQLRLAVESGDTEKIKKYRDLTFLIHDEVFKFLEELREMP